MQKDLNLVLTPREAATEELYKGIICSKLSVKPSDVKSIRILRKSIDARKRQVKINMAVRVFVNEEPPLLECTFIEYQNVSDKPAVIVVGAGPAGLFAALRLIELGYKPILFERGKNVSDRKRDLAQLNRNHILDENSNYAFGEGGAGAFSDGKLYTRSKKRGDVDRILNIFVQHGASQEITYEAHPHIGTDKLPTIIANIRNTIINSGGEVHFSSKVTSLIIDNNECKGVVIDNNKEHIGKAVILATGHSARDVYYFLNEANVPLEFKNFAMGVRVEHPQSLIDSIQYHSKNRGPYLPAAAYSLVSQIDGRGVYSFCMCPGGFIVPASTNQNEMVVNGMSPSHRGSPYANSGIAVEIKKEDVAQFSEYGELAGLKYQQYFEELAFENGGEKFTAPAQCLKDFVESKKSSSIPDNSYFPGVKSSNFAEWMPKFILKSLQKGFVSFDAKMKGFITNQAVILGVESRTSSPVRIPRNKDNYQHIVIKNLYPCGEGAGYAGGIVSAAMDGEICVNNL